VSEQRRSPDVVWHLTPLSRAQRGRALGYAGVTLWLTGLPASGKSVLAGELERRLVERGRPAYVLDGDNVRHGLSGDLGFDRAAREEQVRRVAHVAAMLADAGIVVLVSVVSPFAADRDVARAVHAREGLQFFEVFVDTPLEECERRDPKGLYARARAGALRDLTGVDAPYEPPAAPELTVRTLDERLELAAERLLAAVP
jgi:adenylyl-sulfate kinase